eukprot:Opistho-2@88894
MRISTSLRHLTLILGTALLVACAGPQIHHQQLVALNQGMDPASVVAQLRLPPLSTHDTEIDGQRYLFQSYMLNNGMGADQYLIAYQDGKLKYWGYIDDFRRHPDGRLTRAVNPCTLR